MPLSRVLIVDDNPIFVEAAAFALRAAGFSIECASGASQALELIPVFQPQLILMDVQMPGMDGTELTRALKADANTRDMAIVAFTSFAQKGDEAALRAAGFDGYIAKPLEAMTLVAQVRFWFEGPGSARASRFMWP